MQLGNKMVDKNQVEQDEKTYGASCVKPSTALRREPKHTDMA